MHLQTLKAVATIRNMNQSDLARAAGVSRQRISQWLHDAPADGFVNIQTKHLMSIANALGISPGILLKPLPLLCDEQRLQGETARLLWDKLYPDMTSLLVAALEREPQALARIVQVYGLFASAKLFGGRVWRDFDKYKKFIQPTRRRELECLWQYRQSQTKH